MSPLSRTLDKAVSALTMGSDRFLRDDTSILLEIYVARLRAFMMATTAVILPFLRLDNLLLAYLPVGFAALYTLVFLRFVIPKRPEWLKSGYLSSWLDIAALSLAIMVTGGSHSPFFVVYFALTTLYAVRFGRAQIIHFPAVATLSYAVAIWGSGTFATEWGLFAMRMFWLLTTTLIAGLLSERAESAEKALALELRRTKALLQAAHAPAGSLTLQGVLNAVVQQSRLLTEADIVAVQIYAHPDHPGAFKEQRDRGAAGLAFTRMVRTDPEARGALMAKRRPLAPAELATAVLSAPAEIGEFSSLCAAAIPGRDGDLGYVAAARRQTPLSPLHFEALTAFLERAALAIQNARLYEQLQAQMEELRTLHDQVVRSERLAALGQLAAKVAHELNNPLASIHLYNSLLLEQPAEPEEQRRLAASVQEQVERAKRVVLDILDYSRPREARPETIALNLAVEHGLRLVRHSAGNDGITIAPAYGADLPMVEVDVSQIAQVVTNLTLNAMHAMPEGGTLTISTGLQDDEVYVRFADTGTGIAEDDLQQIFEPFFTTKPAGQGTGLGLAVCRSLVEQHGGRITAESAPGQGSTFTVWLPPAGVREAAVGRRAAV